jgi:hypothetical protein
MVDVHSLAGQMNVLCSTPQISETFPLNILYVQIAWQAKLCGSLEPLVELEST